MQTVKIDCPYCSFDHGISHIPGWQNHYCQNCGNTFVVSIDDQGRINVYRKENIASPRSRSTDSNTSLSGFYDRLKDRLTERKYLGVERISPIQWAFMKPAGAIADPRVIAVIDARSIAEPPSRTFERVDDWFQKAIGRRRGEGLLLFLYFRPAATLVDEIRKSHFYAGSIPVTAGAYDLSTGKYWLSYSGPWETDIFSS